MPIKKITYNHFILFGIASLMLPFMFLPYAGSGYSSRSIFTNLFGGEGMYSLNFGATLNMWIVIMFPIIALVLVPILLHNPQTAKAVNLTVAITGTSLMFGKVIGLGNAGVGTILIFILWTMALAVAICDALKIDIIEKFKSMTAVMVACPNCHAPQKLGTVFCANCGNAMPPPPPPPVQQPFQQPMQQFGGYAPAPMQAPAPMAPQAPQFPAGKTCINCQAPLAADAVFCANCGTKN